MINVIIMLSFYKIIFKMPITTAQFIYDFIIFND